MSTPGRRLEHLRVYWCGHPIAVYRKGCYVNEADSCSDRVYGIGDRRTKILDGPGSRLASAFFEGDTPYHDCCVVDACAQNSNLKPNVHEIFTTQFAQAKFILTPSDGVRLLVKRISALIFKKRLS